MSTGFFRQVNHAKMELLSVLLVPFDTFWRGVPCFCLLSNFLKMDKLLLVLLPDQRVFFAVFFDGQTHEVVKRVVKCVTVFVMDMKTLRNFSVSGLPYLTMQPGCATFD